MSGLAFTGMSIQVKRLSPAIPVNELAFFRATINLAALLPFALAPGFRWVPPSGARALVARGLAGTISLLCYFRSFTYLPLPIASMLAQLTPIFVVAYARLLAGERMGARRLACVGVALAGVAILLEPWAPGMGSLSRIGLGCGLLAAAAAGAAYTALRVASRDASATLITLYFTLIASAATAPLAASGFVVPDPVQSARILAMGVFATLGQAFMTLAFRYVRAGVAAAMGLCTLFWATWLGWLLLGETLDGHHFLGLSLMAAAVLAMTRTRPAHAPGPV